MMDFNDELKRFMDYVESTFEDDTEVDPEEILEAFLDAGEWLPAPGNTGEEMPLDYLWFSMDVLLYDKQEGYYVYSIVEGDDGCLYIVEGVERVNKYAYLISKKYIDIGYADICYME
jgi:hypothetical protein